MPVERNPCAYILASGHYGTLYIGVTSDLMQRLWRHREGITGGCASRYKVFRLVRYELLGSMELAFTQLKNWRRDWKINLIVSGNPDWHELAPGPGPPPIAPRERRDGS